MGTLNHVGLIEKLFRNNVCLIETFFLEKNSVEEETRKDGNEGECDRKIQGEEVLKWD